jgi:hypothetical protein
MILDGVLGITRLDDRPGNCLTWLVYSSRWHWKRNKKVIRVFGLRKGMSGTPNKPQSSQLTYGIHGGIQNDVPIGM